MDCVSSMVMRDVTMEVVHPDDRVEQVPVLLRYETSDPYAVSADFLTGAGRRVSWCFSRELMSEGLEQATGHGDVRIWPVSRGGVKMLNIALMSDDGAAVVGDERHDDSRIHEVLDRDARERNEPLNAHRPPPASSLPRDGTHDHEEHRREDRAGVPVGQPVDEHRTPRDRTPVAHEVDGRLGRREQPEHRPDGEAEQPPLRAARGRGGKGHQKGI